MPKTKETPLSLLAKIREEKAAIEQRQRDATQSAAVDLGRMVLNSGMALEHIEELPALLKRVASLGLHEAMIRLAANPTSTNGSSDLASRKVPKTQSEETADAAA